MIYQPCSMDSVIGRIIRNTRVQDTAYIADMTEWIPEAMEMLQTRQETIGDFCPVEIRFHKGKLPCGLVTIDAVEYKGHRLHYGDSVKNARRPNVHDHPERSIPQTWTSNVINYPGPTDQSKLYFSVLTKVQLEPIHDKHYYQTELGTILTDFPDGTVTLYYRATPTDENGLPLIPDNSNYKEALYWYVRGKMIGAGFDDRLVKMEYCDQKFEFYGARAIAEISYPSPDQMETRVNTFTRLVPKHDYFENYFRVDKPEQFYDPLGPTDSYYI